MKRTLLGILLGLALLAGAAENSSGNGQSAKNVILLIADGTSIEQYTFARWFKGDSLAIEKYRCGSVMTHIADSVIADSAPAASAFATGHRTADKFISVSPPSSGMLRPDYNSPEGRAYKPMKTILEAAVEKGMGTGIVVTCHFAHATPAAFMSHTPDREDKLNIARQTVNSGVSLVFGGGMKYLLPISKGGLLPEGENLKERLVGNGYRLISDRNELSAVGEAKVWGLFADNDLLPEIDRLNTRPDREPSLAEMTAKAIQILSRNPNGFFLMVEGSQIDWAGHANDPGYLVHEIIAFDDAAKVAFDFAEKRNDTMVIALSDHNTGGFSIGNRRTDGSYSKTSMEEMLAPVRKMKCSSFAIAKELGKEPDPGMVRRVLLQSWGIDIGGKRAEGLATSIRNAGKNPQNAICDFFSANYGVFGWTTHGHCGGDVPLAAFGPGAPTGSIDGPEIGRICARALGIGLDHAEQPPSSDKKR